MRRLIDAAEFTENLVDQYCEDCSKCNGSCRHDELMKLVDTQPTAYDVDAVVDQLRKQQEKLETDIFAKESDNWYGQYCNGIHEGIDKAIEIVKAGAKYDD